MKIAIGLSRNKSWLSKAIRWFGKRKTGEATYSHAFLKVDDIVIEEHGLGLKIFPYSKYNSVNHVLYKPLFITKEQSEQIYIKALTQVGTYKGLYGFGSIPLFALDAIFKTYIFTKYLNISHFKSCAEWCCYIIYKETKYEPFKCWKSMSPDDIHDHVRGNNLWKEIK